MHKFFQHQILCLGIGRELAKYPQVTYEQIYKKEKGMKKLRNKFFDHFGLANEDAFGDWKDHIEKYDTVLISDDIRGTDIVSYIRKKNSKARIIIYYLNPVLGRARNYPPKYQALGCELYSFDPHNAEDFHMTFKPYYYLRMGRQEETLPSETFRYDVFFIGGDKGRLLELMTLKEKMEALGLSCKMLVKQTRHKHYSSADKANMIAEGIPYEKVCEYIRQSRAVLDIVQEGQYGLTLRPYEALHFGRKLITDSKTISSYDFYRTQNVFQLGKNDLKDLPAFLRSPLCAVADEIKSKYIAENWLDGFFL